MVMSDESKQRVLDAAISRLNAQHSIPKPYTIKRASRADADQISAIAKSAGETFATIPALADLIGDNLEISEIYSWLDAGGICVVSEGEVLLGFAAAQVMDGALYINEISVRSDYQGKGIGGQLIETLFEWARERKRREVGNARVSLLTYAEVSWNGPWYARRGFKEVDPESIGPNHGEQLRLDASERGLTRPGYRRCAMVWEDNAGSSVVQEGKQDVAKSG